MSIEHKPTLKDGEWTAWQWKFIINRRIGDYIVRWDWVEYRYKWETNCYHSQEWRYGGTIIHTHTEFVSGW